jgi:hypothetical protein
MLKPLCASNIRSMVEDRLKRIMQQYMRMKAVLKTKSCGGMMSGCARYKIWALHKTLRPHAMRLLMKKNLI